jgi:hypothetical protein
LNNEELKLLTMTEMMAMYNHSYVDVVKMDVEGSEFLWLKYEAADLIPKIGQMMVELHLHHTLADRVYPGQDAEFFLRAVESKGFRLFHKEVNVHAPLWGIEISLIQKSWVAWDLNKSSLLL